MDNNRIYVGSGKEKFEGSLINTTLNISKLMKMAEKYIFEYGGDKYIKLKVAKKKETDEYGKTHYIEVDTWKPSNPQIQSFPKSNQNTNTNEEDMTFGEFQKQNDVDEDLPF